MAKRAVDDLPDLSKPAIPAKGEPYQAERPAVGVRMIKVSIEIPMLPPGDDDYISRQINAKLLTMEQRRLFRSIVNGLGAMYPLPPGTGQKKASAVALRYLLDEILARMQD